MCFLDPPPSLQKSFFFYRAIEIKKIMNNQRQTKLIKRKRIYAKVKSGKVYGTWHIRAIFRRNHFYSIVWIWSELAFLVKTTWVRKLRSQFASLQMYKMLIFSLLNKYVKRCKKQFPEKEEIWLAQSLTILVK